MVLLLKVVGSLTLLAGLIAGGALALNAVWHLAPVPWLTALSLAFGGLFWGVLPLGLAEVLERLEPRRARS